MAEPVATPETPIATTPAASASAMIFDAEESVASATPATPTPPTPAVVEKPKHTARALRLAGEFGFTQAEIDEMTPEELTRSVDIAAIQTARMNKEYATAMAHIQARQPQPPPTPDAVAATAANPEDELSLDENVVHPEVIKANRLLKDMAKKLREQEAREQSRNQAEAERTNLERFEVIDNAFESLGDTYRALLGNGSASDLKPESAEMKRRMAVLQQTGLDFNKPMSAKALTKAIVSTAQLLFGAAAQPAVADPYAAGVNGSAPVTPSRPVPPKDSRNGRFVSATEYENGALATPTQRKEIDLPPGRERAVANVAKILGDRGAYVDEGRPGDAILDDFPGTN